MYTNVKLFLKSVNKNSKDFLFFIKRKILRNLYENANRIQHFNGVMREIMLFLLNAAV